MTQYVYSFQIYYICACSTVYRLGPIVFWPFCPLLRGCNKPTTTLQPWCTYVTCLFPKAMGLKNTDIASSSIKLLILHIVK